MNVELKSHHYNYYNVKGRYSPETKQKAGWVQEYERNITDRVESNNSNPDSKKFQAYIKLENIYYDKGVANRAKYSSENEVRTALAQKYLFGKEYATYSYTERQAMYNNELNMTLYGHCSNFCDPRLGGPVYCLKSLGLDFRDFVQKKDGLYNSDGKNILNVYKNALKYSNTVPAQFKGAAYDAFEEKINQITSKNVNSIPDLILNIGYSNGELVDSDNISILISKFDFLA